MTAMRAILASRLGEAHPITYLHFRCIIKIYMHRPDLYELENMNRGFNLWQGDLPLCPEISFLFERHQGGLLLKQKGPNWQSGLRPLEEYRCLQ